MWSASGSGSGDNIVSAVAVHITRGDKHAAGKSGMIGKKAAHGSSQRLAGEAVEDADMRSAARSGGRDDIRHAITANVPHRHAHAAGETRVIGEEAELLLKGD